MALIADGVTPTQLLAVDASFKAARASIRPVDHGALGQYQLGVQTGILPIIGTLGAGAEVFQFRWVDATRIALLRSIKIAAAVSTTFFAAGVPVQIDLVKSTAWSAQGTGGTGVTPAATLKQRTSMGSTLLASGDARIATTAALGAGTKTLEANSLGLIVAGGPITASLAPTIIAPGTPLYEANVAAGDHPLALVANEGISIRVVNAPGTGTWTLSVQMSWAEVTAY